jgi:hypothetical protein
MRCGHFSHFQLVPGLCLATQWIQGPLVKTLSICEKTGRKASNPVFHGCKPETTIVLVAISENSALSWQFRSAGLKMHVLGPLALRPR